MKTEVEQKELIDKMFAFEGINPESAITLHHLIKGLLMLLSDCKENEGTFKFFTPEQAINLQSNAEFCCESLKTKFEIVDVRTQ